MAANWSARLSDRNFEVFVIRRLFYINPNRCWIWIVFLLKRGGWGCHKERLGFSQNHPLLMTIILTKQNTIRSGWFWERGGERCFTRINPIFLCTKLEVSLFFLLKARVYVVRGDTGHAWTYATCGGSMTWNWISQALDRYLRIRYIHNFRIYFYRLEQVITLKLR